jgi:hypothetical protein
MLPALNIHMKFIEHWHGHAQYGCVRRCVHDVGVRSMGIHDVGVQRVDMNCSVSRWRPHKVDKRMVLEYTHGLFIT